MKAGTSRSWSPAVGGRTVVIGAGLAGVRVVEGLRRRGYTGSIVLIGQEAVLPYDRPPLSKGVLRGLRTVTPLRGSFDDLEIDLRLGVGATSLDPVAHSLTVQNGRTLEYDVAVIATGGEPIVPASLAAKPGTYVLRTSGDAARLAEHLRECGHITVMGGGLIGCEVAATARQMGCQVTIVEAAASLMWNSLGPVVGGEIDALHRSNGIEVITGQAVRSIDGYPPRLHVTLQDGRSISTGGVVVAVGMRPAAAWLASSSIQLDRGIVCDSRGRTAAEDVFAVGDVAQWWHPATQSYRVAEHWTSAVEQADVVAQVIADGAESAPELAAPAYFWSDQFDLKIQAVGFPDPHADAELLEVDGRKLALLSRHGHVVAAVGFSAGRLVMGLRSAVVAGEHVTRVRDRILEAAVAAKVGGP
jgi:3-phenylpropionate/trans-cinnamate dioxygenase ferredoxin reductase subunit